MNNFKSGSGNLDFGNADEDESGDETPEQTPEPEIGQEQVESTDEQQPAAVETVDSSRSTDSGDDWGPSDRESSTAVESSPSERDYPYFVRRSNVGDERDTRLEIHVRDKVAEQEAGFRNDLAEHLDTTEVSKTDAREFALLAAFQHPDRVAELMQAEGFGALD